MVSLPFVLTIYRIWTNTHTHTHTLTARTDIAVGPSKVHVHTSRNKLQPDQHEPLEAKQAFAAKQTNGPAQEVRAICLSVCQPARAKDSCLEPGPMTPVPR